MTILEVLFAIMITTVGLLGAIAVFPVASEYARKGRLNDEVTVCADAATHKMDAMGMRRPERWLTYVQSGGNWQPVNFYTTPPIVQPGISYCLDPRFIAANLTGSPPAPNYPEAVAFPAAPRTLPAYAGNNHPNFGTPRAPRMQRITLANGSPGSTAPYLPNVFPMGRFQADLVFSFEDQLSYERPGVQKGEVARADNAEPAFQLYSPIKTAGGILPGKREDEGKLSWLATLVPKIDRYNGTLEDKYVLSIVVFYNRPPSIELTLNPAKPAKEWTATILGQSTTNPGSPDFHSTGYGGGEVTITADNANKLKMRAGDWLMLSGLVQANVYVGGFPRPTIYSTYKWYRVSDADEDPYEFPLGSGIWKRDVSLVGPDWDMQDILPVSGPDGFPDDVEVTIVPGIVAVSDRTVRLELGGTGY